MHYYLDLSAEPSVIGANNGTHAAIFDKNNFESKKIYDQFNTFFEWPEIYLKDPPFEGVEIPIKKVNLLNNGKFTDFMGFSPDIPYVKFLISEKTKYVFSKCLVQRSLFFETKVENKKTGVNHPYYFFYSPDLKLDNIIFEKSELYTRKIYTDDTPGLKHKDTFYNIESRKHYDELRESLFSPSFSKICIDKEYEKYDLLIVYTDVFVSEKLKKLIEENNLTGHEIGTLPSLIFG